MNPVVHFEMPYEDAARAKKFYEGAFGWNMQQMGPEMGNYLVVSVMGAADAMPDAPRGMIGGGLFKKSEANACPSFVVAVPDIQAAIERLRMAGGAIREDTMEQGKPMEIPGVGLYVGFTDTEGNRVSLLQPHPRQ